MKKFLSVLLAVMMVLSTVSFALPSAVSVVDNAYADAYVPEAVAVPEEQAVLAADDTWYDIEKGTLLFNMDFETDNSGSAVSASAYDAISLGSYSAGAGELVSGLGRLNPDVAGNYDIGFRYTQSGSATVAEENGNKYFSVNSSASNQFSLYLGNTFTKAGKYVLEYDYKVVSSAEPNYIQYNTPSNGNDTGFKFGEWASSTSAYELTGASNAARVIFYARSNYASTDTLMLDNIKVWYYDESVDYEEILNPDIETNDVWEDAEKGQKLFTIDFTAKNDKKALDAFSWDTILNRLDNNPSSGELISDLGRINPDVDGSDYRISINYIDNTKTELVTEGENTYLAIAPDSTKGDVSLYLGGFYDEEGTYTIETSYKFVKNGEYTVDRIRYETLGLEYTDASYLSTGNWVDLSETHEHTGCSHGNVNRTRFTADGYNNTPFSANDRIYIDNITVYYKAPVVEEPDDGGDEGEVASEWENTEKGYKLFAVDFETKNDGTEVISTDVAAITNGRVDSTPASGGIAATSAARVNPEYSSIARLNVKGGAGATIQGTADNQYLAVTSAGDSLILSQLYVGDGTYVIEFDTNNASFSDVRGSYNPGILPTSEAVDGTWTRHTHVVENVTEASSKTCSSYQTDNIRFLFSTKPTMYDNIVVYYQPTGWTPPSDDEGDEGEDEPETGKKWYDEELGDLLYEIDFETKNDDSALTASDIALITNGRLDGSNSAGVAVADIAKINPEYADNSFRVGIKDGGTVTLADGSLTSTATGTPSFYFRNTYVGKGQYVFMFDYNVSCDASFYANSGYTNGTLTKEEIDSTWMRVTYVVSELNDDNHISADTYASDYLRMMAHRASADGTFVFDNVKVYYKPEGWTPPSDGEGDEGEDEPEVNEWVDNNHGIKLFTIDLDGDNKYTTATLSNLNNRIDGTNDNAASNGLYLSAIGRTNPEYASYENTFKYSFKDGGTPVVEGTDDKYFKHTSGSQASVMVANPFVGAGTYTVTFNHNANVTFKLHSGYGSSNGTITTTAVDSTWATTVATVYISAQGSDDFFRIYANNAPGSYMIDDVSLFYKPEGWTPPVVPDEPGEGGEDDGAWLDEEKGNLLYTIDFETKNNGTALETSDYASITSGRLDNSPTSAGVPVSNVGRVNPAFSAGYRINFKDAGTSSLLGTDNKYMTQNVGSAMSVYLGSFYVGAGRYTVEFDYNTACGATFSVHSGFTSGTLTTEVLDETWTRLTYVVDATEDLSYIRFLSSGPSNESKFTYDNFNVYFKETMLDVTVKANGNANVSDVKIGVDVENGAHVGSILANVDLSKSTKKLLGASLTADGAVLTADYVVMPKEVNTLYLIWGGDVVIDETPWSDEVYGKLIFDMNFDGKLATTAQSRWASISGFGAQVNPDHELNGYFKSMWGEEDIGGTTWIPSASPYIVAEADGNRYYTQPHDQTYNDFSVYAPAGGDYAIWEEAGIFTIKYDVKISGDITVANHFVDPNLAKNFALTDASIRIFSEEKANKDGWTTLVYEFDATEYAKQEHESLGRVIFYTQTVESAKVENAFICYDNVQVYWKPAKVNVTLKPDTNYEVEETTVAAPTNGILVSELLKSVNTEDTTLMAKGIRNADSSVVLGLDDTLLVLEDSTYYIVWEENVWNDDELGMLIMNGNFEGDFQTTGINRWPAIAALGASRNPEYNFEGVTGLQYTVSSTGIALDESGMWIPADYKRTEGLNSYMTYPIGSNSYSGEGYTNFNAYAMGKGASQYQYQGAGIYTISAKVRFPEELGVLRARVSANAYNGNGGIVSAAHQDHVDVTAGVWNEISLTWATETTAEYGLGSAEIYLFYEPTSEKIYVDIDDFKIYYKPFTASVTLRANNNPVAKDVVIENVSTNGISVEEMISKIKTPLGGMELVGLAYDKAGTNMLEGNVVIGGDARFFMIWKDSDIDPNAPVSENVNSIRTDDPVGMRFRSYMTSEVYGSATQVGWIATRLDMLEAKSVNPYDFFIDTDVTKVYAYNKDTDGTNKVFGTDDINTYVTAVLYNIPEKHYTTTLVARPFTVVDGVTYYGFPVERSICEVAEAVRDGGYAGCSNDQIAYIKDILVTCGKSTEPAPSQK